MEGPQTKATGDIAERLAELLAPLLSRLARSARNDPDVARRLRELGELLLEISAETAHATESDGAPEEPAESLPTTRKTLAIGGTKIVLEVPDDGAADATRTNARDGGDPPRLHRAPLTKVSLVVARCRAKAEACDWAIERRRRIRDGADFDHAIKPRDQDMGRLVRSLENCRAWPLDPYAELPDDHMLSEAAGCYRALADALEFTERIRDDDDLFESHGQRAYELTAACCSALRVALEACGIGRDADQHEAFLRLRRYVFDDQLYVERHMRVADPAAPDGWADRQEEIQRIQREIAERAAEEKERGNLLGKLEYETKRWDDDDETLARIQKIDESLERLVELGVRTSDPRVRDALVRIADQIPDEHEASAQLTEALRHVDQAIARRQGEPGLAQATDEEDDETEDVTAARKLLEGRAVVLIGGECRPRSKEALEVGLGLSRLDWITTRPHEPTSRFTAAVQRDDIALVMLAIRWSSHSFGAVRDVCQSAGKAFVRLPRGYGVNQVAREILAQASRSLSNTSNRTSS